jgi:hypothetical protein
MPGLARKVIICAAVDGLVLHPLNSRSKDQQQQRSAALPPIRIKYGDASISPAPRDSAPDPASLPPNSSFEAFGIVGKPPPSSPSLPSNKQTNNPPPQKHKPHTNHPPSPPKP